MKIKLDKKYQILIGFIKDKILMTTPIGFEVERKFNTLLDVLSNPRVNSMAMIFSGNDTKKAERLICDIYFADEIELIEPKYNWRVKSEKFGHPYIGSDVDGKWMFLYGKYEKDAMTESELKKPLEGTGLSFEAFEKVSVDD